MKLADHQSAVVAKVGGPPLLRLCHQGMEVLDHGLQVEGLEFFGVVERLAHRVGEGGVLVENLNVELVRPPVTVRLVHDRALARALVSLRVHVSLQLCSRFFLVPYTRIIGSWKVIQLHGTPNKASWHAQQKRAGHAQYPDHGDALHNLTSELMKEPGSPPGLSAGPSRRSTGCGINPQALGYAVRQLCPGRTRSQVTERASSRAFARSRRAGRASP